MQPPAKARGLDWFKRQHLEGIASETEQAAHLLNEGRALVRTVRAVASRHAERGYLDDAAIMWLHQRLDAAEGAAHDARETIERAQMSAKFLGGESREVRHYTPGSWRREDESE